LVELARIVHKNKQSGADVSSGRVGSTDYFAGLDDVAGEPAAADTPPTRREPTFSETPAASPIVGAENPRTEPTVAETDAPANVSSLDELKQAFDATPPAAAETSSHVSALWPGMPSGETETRSEEQSVKTAVPSDRGHPDSFTPSVPHRESYPAFEPVAANDPTSLNPTLSGNLEQNLTAELEDELIGALRQSVDETQTFAEPKAELPQEPYSLDQKGADLTGFGATQQYLDSLRYESETPETHRVETEVTAPTVPAADQARAPHGRIEASPEPSIRTEPTAPVSPAYRDDQPRLDEPVAPPEPAAVQRPQIDEDDLFAALNPVQPPASTTQGYSDQGQAGEPAGIDALFADLDFPPPGERKAAPQQTVAQPAPSQPAAARHTHDVQSSLGEDTTGASEIDDMTWPAAAAAVPQSDDDETPPPPEGYDLDAVARAMQESDPSLTGAGVLPPHSSAERDAVPQAREKSRRGMVVAAGVLGVAVLGGAGFLLFDGDSVVVPSGPPPIISGLQEPLKIYPDQAQAPADDQSAKLIYDRVEGNGASGPDRLVLPETPQPAELPPAPAGTNGSADLVPGAPKRVRTVIVRPDGTFVSDDDQAAPAAAVTAPATPAPATPAPATPATNDTAPAADTDASRVVATTPIAPETGDAPVSATDAPAATDAPSIVAGTDQPETAPAVSEPAVPVPSVLPRKKPAAPVQVASAPTATTAPAANNDGPLNLTQQATAPATPAPSGSTGTIASGTYIVQVTSQRSAAAASDAYSGLQRRYPSILGNRDAVIVSANVQDRGVFYRARIPTGSRDEAISLCERLQTAGGDCFVRRQP